MVAFGMTCLGGFIGFVIMTALINITDWTKPVAIVSGLLSAVVAGGVLVLLRLIDNSSGTSSSKLAFYPIGLVYGAGVTSLYYVGLDTRITLFRVLHILSVVAATVLLFLVLFVPSFRERLPP